MTASGWMWALHAEYTSHEALMRDVADYARETGLRVHLHLSETQKEHEECKARHNGLTPAALFEKVGLVRCSGHRSTLRLDRRGGL